MLTLKYHVHSTLNLKELSGHIFRETMRQRMCVWEVEEERKEKQKGAGQRERQ